ncbi:MAG: class I SAM-dependent methyltransferase [Geminicoccaceae bacterium]
MVNKIEDAVARHYAQPALGQTIIDALQAAGADLSALTPEQLAPVDEFHTAGRLTTLKSLEMVDIDDSMHVLDAGSGIGGTARCLALEKGCRVTGIDLTRAYVDTARMLTERMGLEDRCSFVEGSVLDLPFDDETFDAVLTFHVAMNIEDRATFYRELARVLRPRAYLCLFDVMTGPKPGIPFPMPWAETEATSFLRSAEETRRLAEQAGFVIDREESQQDLAINFFRERFARARDGHVPPLGLHLLTGNNAKEKFANMLTALEADQIDPVIMIGRRP